MEKLGFKKGTLFIYIQNPTSIWAKKKRKQRIKKKN